mgnify:CR=1 FL=1
MDSQVDSAPTPTLPLAASVGGRQPTPARSEIGSETGRGRGRPRGSLGTAKRAALAAANALPSSSDDEGSMMAAAQEAGPPLPSISALEQRLLAGGGNAIAAVGSMALGGGGQGSLPLPPMSRREALLSAFRLGKGNLPADMSISNPAVLTTVEGWIALALSEAISPSDLIPSEVGIAAAEYSFGSTLALIYPSEAITPELKSRFVSVLLEVHYISNDQSLSLRRTVNYLNSMIPLNSKEINGATFRALRSEMPRGLAAAAAYDLSRWTRMGLPSRVITMGMTAKSKHNGGGPRGDGESEPKEHRSESGRGRGRGRGGWRGGRH